MKKSLIALAVLAASGAAMAQSSVTLYGVADAYVGQNEAKKITAAAGEVKTSQGVVNGSGLSSSRWGLKGAEDLGGGLAAVFTLEGGFDISTGGLANNGGSSNGNNILFGRTASAGLKGAFGEARLGRQYTAYDTLRGASNNTYDSNTFATTGAIWGTGIQDYSNRVNNAISYSTPSFGGFSGAVVYGFGEDKNTNDVGTPAGAAAKSNTPAQSVSLHVKYANGPLLVGYAFQREKDNGGTSNLFSGANGPGLVAGTVPTASPAPAGAVDKREYNLFGGSYDFGVAKLTGSYNQAKNSLLKDKEYQVGVSVPFGAAALAAGYSRSKSDGTGFNNAGISTKGTGYSLLGTYDLSKRTTLYAGYINLKSEAAATSATTAAFEGKRALVATGLRHTF